MSERIPEENAWKEANGNGWIALALLVVAVVIGAVAFGSGDRKVAENGPVPASATR